MKINKENKLCEVPVDKSFLADKKFSYKMYLNMFYISWWNKIENRYEMYINYITIKEMEEILNVSKTLINNQLKNKIYRLKEDDMGFRHLYFFTPTKNYISIPIKAIHKIKTLDEMTIRAYLYIQSFSGDVIYGVSHLKILKEIGYSTNSGKNESKICKSISTLLDLKLINREIKNNGKKKYSIYYKLKN